MATNHFQRSLELLNEVDLARGALRDEYAAGGRANVVARLHQTINVSLKLADIHAQLAEVQALVDVGSFLDSRVTT